MKVTQISLSYQRTHNMGNYSNIKPTINLVADVDENEKPEGVIADLHETAKKYVHGFIDKELERDDQPPYFFSGRRYKLAKFPFERVVIILPQESKLDKDWIMAAHITHERRRHPVLVDLAAEEYPDFEMFDASTPGYPLPELIKVTIVERQIDDVRYTIFLPGHLHRSHLPGGWDSYLTGTKSVYAFTSSFALDKIGVQAEVDGGVFLNLLKEGVEGLPDLPEPGPQPAPDIWDDDDDNDDEEADDVDF